MNDNLTDEQKSTMLAKAMGWRWEDESECPRGFAPDLLDGTGNNIPNVNPYVHAFSEYPNLYDPANMALAWRVLNWGGGPGHDELMCMWFYEEEITLLPPEKAQRLWLDEILARIEDDLEYAIEAGIVKVQDA